MRKTSKGGKTTTAAPPKHRASHFMAYTPQDYCPRCRGDTSGVTRTLCSPGTFILANCHEAEAKGEHLHCMCRDCNREWIMFPPPVWGRSYA